MKANLFAEMLAGYPRFRHHLRILLGLDSERINLRSSRNAPCQTVI